MCTTAPTSFSAYEATARLTGHHGRLRPAREIAARARRAAGAQRRDRRA